MVTKKRFLRYLFLALPLFFLFSGLSFSAVSPEMNFSFGRLGVKVPPVTLAPANRPAAVPLRIVFKEGMLQVENTHYQFIFDTAPALTLTRLYNKYTQSECLTKDKPNSRLFFVWVDGKRLEAKDFKVEGCRISGNKATVSLACPAEKVNGTLSVSADNSGEVSLGLSFVNLERKIREVKVLFPFFEHLAIGDNPKDNYYLFPYKGGWCGNEPYELHATYGNHPGSIQLVSIFNPNLGGGLYARVEDNSGRPKTIILKKKDADLQEKVPLYAPLFPENKLKDEDLLSQDKGITVAFYYPVAYRLKPGVELSLPRAVVGVHAGDFKVALDSYRKWLHTWFKPLNTPQWYKDDFNCVVSHDISGNTGFEKGFLKDNKIILSELVKPWMQYVPIAVWGERFKDDHIGDKRDYPWYRSGMVGDYQYEESWGGAAAWRDQIKKSNEKGVYVNLYGATPYFVWAYSKIYEEHPDWALINEQGQPEKDYWGDFGVNRLRMIDMCPQVKGWQDYVAATNARIAKDTGANGIYLDTMNLIRQCYNTKHKHYEYPAMAAEPLLKKIVAAVRAVNPQTIVDIEDPCSDYLMQFIDGYWMKNFERDLKTYQEVFDNYSLYFVRFVVPEVKCFAYGPNFADGARRSFFNAVGYNWSDMQDIKDPDTGRVITVAEQLDYLAAVGGLFKENGNAFSSLQPECLVPTLKKNLFANYFPTGSKALYTLYNKNDVNFSGPVIKTKPGSGYHCVELLYDNEATFDSRTGIVSMSVPAWEVVCLAKFPQILKVSQSKNAINVTLSGKVSVPSIRIVLDQDTGKEEGRKITVTNNKATINLKDYQAKRLIIKLFSGKYLADERIVEM